MKKQFEMFVRATDFFGKEDRTPETEKIVRDLFYLEEGSDLDTAVVALNLKIEDFLWALFSMLPQPASPLKLAAHRKHLDKIAEKLNETLESDELPKLPKEELDMIKHYVDDEDAFAEVKVPFNAVPQKEGEDVLPKALPLPAINVLKDIGFVSSLDMVFNGTP